MPEFDLDNIQSMVQKKDVAGLQEVQSEVFTVVTEYRNKAVKALTQKEFQEYWNMADEIFKTLNYINYNIGLLLDS